MFGFCSSFLLHQRLVLLLIFIILPIYFAIVLHCKRESLTDEATRAKIGSLYLGMRVDTTG